MTTHDDKRRRSPVDRFRRILSAEGENEGKAETKNSPKRTQSPIVNLPKAKPLEEGAAPETTSPPSAVSTGFRSENNRFLPVFWTAASIVSLAVNAILLIALMILLRGAGGLNAAGLAPGLLGGLYSNFERMDAAHIKTVIPVQTSIPLNMSIPVQTTTRISLAEDVTIPGAHVKINTPLFNIDAPASVTLPAGTSLNVAMNFNVPVQADVPVTLNVPVDIAIQDTDLHPAILGLQNTIKPIYCMVSPAASSSSGTPVCK